MNVSELRNRWQRLTYRGPSVDDLREQYAGHGRIDVAAPVMAHRQVVIDAPVDRVWRVLSTPARWGLVHPEIDHVHAEGTVAVGQRFTWRRGRARLTSTFCVVDEAEELSWITTGLGVRSVHRHVVSAASGGQTRLFTEASVAGVAAVLFLDHDRLSTALEHWLEAIAAAVRSQASEDFMSPADWLAPIEEVTP